AAPRDAAGRRTAAPPRIREDPAGEPILAGRQLAHCRPVGQRCRAALHFPARNLRRVPDANGLSSAEPLRIELRPAVEAFAQFPGAPDPIEPEAPRRVVPPVEGVEVPIR